MSPQPQQQLASITAPQAELSIASRLAALPSAHAILLGEQHDNPAHQRIAQEVVATLAAQNRLAALAIEMADQGADTARLGASATEAEVRAALNWNEAAWKWAVYQAPVMAAVRAGRPVLGANLPRSQMRAAMGNAALDASLPPGALTAQRSAIREGHCNALPESQIAPMARIQIARDVAMAHTLERALAVAAQRQIVVFLAGSGHVDREVGVLRHLAAAVPSAAVLLVSREADGSVQADAAARFDAIWPTPPAPQTDYCAQFKSR